MHLFIGIIYKQKIWRYSGFNANSDSVKEHHFVYLCIKNVHRFDSVLPVYKSDTLGEPVGTLLSL